jgi:hypothetical protein
VKTTGAGDDEAGATGATTTGVLEAGTTTTTGVVVVQGVADAGTTTTLTELWGVAVRVVLITLTEDLGATTELPAETPRIALLKTRAEVIWNFIFEESDR